MSRKKRAQAAVEFLMTYGIAILIIILAIGVLVYFDVLNPRKFIADRCEIGGNIIGCRDFSVSKSGSEIRLKLSNNVGDNIKITSIAAKSEGISAQDNSCKIENPNGIPGQSFGNILSISRSDVYTIQNCPISLQPGDKIKIGLEVSFEKISAAGEAIVPRKVIGDLITAVQ